MLQMTERLVLFVPLCWPTEVSGGSDGPDQRGGDWQWDLWTGLQSAIQEDWPCHRCQSKTRMNTAHITHCSHNTLITTSFAITLSRLAQIWKWVVIY